MTYVPPYKFNHMKYILSYLKAFVIITFHFYLFLHIKIFLTASLLLDHMMQPAQCLINSAYFRDQAFLYCLFSD